MKESLAAKLAEKSKAYYSKGVGEITRQLNEQKEWIIADKQYTWLQNLGNLHRDKIGTKTDTIEDLKPIPHAFKPKEKPRENKQRLATKTNQIRFFKLKQSLELAKPELKEMDSKMLEEKLQALFSDKA
ncbi:hypothetical protein M9H77_35661 [Catharanthus roseus]|uniref:Uncharacterized protein n=1 Tax=Catharanthus roseus TaxID=4058 RepID=A0ACB9ZPM6_CATRO|nr:hypothetical protein M9H77_35661 [Catharanthus roseus]